MAIQFDKVVNCWQGINKPPCKTSPLTGAVRETPQKDAEKYATRVRSSCLVILPRQENPRFSHYAQTHIPLIPWYFLEFLVISWLVGGLEHFLCSIIYGIILPIDWYFSEGLKPPTSYCFVYISWTWMPLNSAWFPVDSPWQKLLFSR